MSKSLFLHLTTKQAWGDALKVGVYSLSTKGKTRNLKAGLELTLTPVTVLLTTPTVRIS